MALATCKIQEMSHTSDDSLQAIGGCPIQLGPLLQVSETGIPPGVALTGDCHLPHTVMTTVFLTPGPLHSVTFPA